MVSVHPARWCTSPLGVVPAGLGEGVGDCQDVAILPRVGFLLPLGMLVAKWVPTPCYRDAYLVGTPKWACWGKDWLKQCETTISPFVGRVFLVSKRTIYFSGGYFMDVSNREGQASWAWLS